MRTANRDSTSAALAFIDVMACGLGAVILLFFIIDFNSVFDFDSVEQAAPVIQEQAATPGRGSTQEIAQLEAQVAQTKAEVAELRSSLSASIVRTAQAKAKMESVPQAPAPPVAEVITQGRSGDLFGLKIQGKNILVMFDVSASMAEEKLVDVIVGTSDPSGKRLAQGRKWAVAKRVLRWTVLNAPENSRLKILSFSEKAKIHSTKWEPKSQATNTVNGLLASLRPNGGTNLGTALAEASKAGAVDSIYLVTDGLPTLKGKGTSLLGRLRNCKLVGNGYVSGDCREVYFDSAVKNFRTNSKATVNVILLPMEGDPKAAPKYWMWAKSTGGVLFSPAPGWP